jgi:rod shape-determining protein MreD
MNNSTRLSLNKRLMMMGSIIVAWILMIVPFPEAWHWLKPQWVTLVLIYWIFSCPCHIGVWVGWVSGFGMDILTGLLWGQYALAMTVVVYLGHMLRYRLRLFPFWQQALVVCVLVGFGQLALLMTQWFIGQPPTTLLYWTSTLSSVLIWPWVYRILRFYERRL